MVDIYGFIEEDLNALDQHIVALERRIRDTSRAVGDCSRGDREAADHNTSGETNLLLLSRRLEELRITRAHAQLVKVRSSPKRVSIGTTVTLEDLTTGNIVSYTIGSYKVFTDDHTVISYIAPLAKLILNAKVGDVRNGPIAGKTRKLKILAISVHAE